MIRPEILALVPARGGSKGLPGKNILPLAGHPLIAYSIRAAQAASSITRTIVTTDDEQIAAVARHYGAEVPFMRPAAYAQDMSTDLEVFEHALAWLWEHEQYRPDWVVQLRPTSPIRFVEDIEACIERVRTAEADSIRVVTKAPLTPYKMWRVPDPEAPMIPLLTLEGEAEPFNQPRQKLPQVYWQIGTLDVIRTPVITEQHSMSGRRIMPYIVDATLAVDIDDQASFDRAAEVMRRTNCVKFGAEEAAWAGSGT